METKSLLKKIPSLSIEKEKVNISNTQRVVSVASGAYMVLSAITSLTSKKKTGVLGPVWNVVSGSYLLYRGITGHCYIQDAISSSNNKITSYLHKN